jgi:Na+/proline symporter
MQLTSLDWVVILAYFALSLGIGLYYRKRAGRGIDEYFVSGRQASWWLAGTSMVATTFAADTPLAVTGMVANGGIAGNWLWWNFAFSGILTVFFYARLWRRSGVLTDVEFAEIRYSGKPAAFLRGFRALYLAGPINCIVMGWVNLAMVKILGMVLGVDKTTAIFITLGITALTCAISALSGLHGVLITDFFQFIIMMGMAIVLAFFAVDAVGGIDALKTQLLAIDRQGSPLAFFPEPNSAWMPLITFFVYIAVNWWATWYPGAEPGGGGFIAQRMLATRDERESVFATLWFNVAFYAIRPWPWILVALVALVTYPGLADAESGYVKVMIDHLPASLRGLMVAGFLAAFMSTISTELNWGASYLINDFYRRFIEPDASERKLILASRVATVLLAVAASALTFYMESIAGAWKLLLATGAGTGGVLILRWFWWRINAWSEVAAMTAAFAVSLYLQLGLKFNTDDPVDFAYVILITVGATTITWVAVTLLTSPEPRATLLAFYRRARPYPAFWGPIAAEAPEVRPSSHAGHDFVNWICGCILIYGSLFGVGKWILHDWLPGVPYLVAATISAYVIYRSPSWKEN